MRSKGSGSGRLAATQPSGRASGITGPGRRRAWVPVGGESLALARMDSEALAGVDSEPPAPQSDPATTQSQAAMSAAEAAAWLSRNAVDCLPDGGLEAKLALGRPL